MSAVVTCVKCVEWSQVSFVPRRRISPGRRASPFADIVNLTFLQPNDEREQDRLDLVSLCCHYRPEYVGANLNPKLEPSHLHNAA